MRNVVTEVSALYKNFSMHKSNSTKSRKMHFMKELTEDPPLLKSYMVRVRPHSIGNYARSVYVYEYIKTIYFNFTMIQLYKVN